MSYNVGIIIGLTVSFGSFFVTLLLYFIGYTIADKCNKNNSEYGLKLELLIKIY